MTGVLKGFWFVCILPLFFILKFNLLVSYFYTRQQHYRHRNMLSTSLCKVMRYSRDGDVDAQLNPNEVYPEWLPNVMYSPNCQRKRSSIDHTGEAG